ncbi:MAG: hypothetical protein M3404_00760 [Actinomycetota bacterium]|nr:hypothetical protein [Actinomycetota bacterium]
MEETIDLAGRDAPLTMELERSKLSLLDPGANCFRLDGKQRCYLLSRVVTS